MAFKTMDQYNEEKYGGFFSLRNDKDYADVVFLYRSSRDVLICDAHYIKSAEYSGYVHCCGKGCPVCGKGIRVQTKLFIPLYNYSTGQIEFWDRNVRFENQLVTDVFDKYPNPSEVVFRITRKGAYGDINTTYSIVVKGANSPESGCKTYQQILAENNIIFPDYYSQVIKEYSAGELYSMLNDSAESYSNQAPAGGYSMPNYQVSPRRSASANVPEGSELEGSTPSIPAPSVDEALPFSEDPADEVPPELTEPVKF